MGNTKLFDRMAEQYETPERVEIAKVLARKIRGTLEDAPSKTAIDFGCGTGMVGMELLDEFGSMLFVDSSENMIAVVERKIEKVKAANARTYCLDLEKGERIGAKADYIILVQVLLHIRDIAPFLSQLFEMLEPNGHLLIVDFDKNDEIVSDLVHNGFEQDELTALLTRAGFGMIRAETFYQGEKNFMGKDASLFMIDAGKPSQDKTEANGLSINGAEKLPIHQP